MAFRIINTPWGDLHDVGVVQLPSGGRVVLLVSADTPQMTKQDVKRLIAQLRAMLGEFDDAPDFVPGGQEWASAPPAVPFDPNRRKGS